MYTDTKADEHLHGQQAPVDDTNMNQQTTVIRLEQVLDVSKLVEIETRMAEAVSSGIDIIDVEMKDLSYITASGAQLLIKLCVHAQEGQRIRFLHPNQQVRELLMTIGITHYIDDDEAMPLEG